ncbi:MAG: chromosome segregation protein SMC, partial [Clostridia bacterium]|nr:chromosome segregation protein SMC [Clostridia bacterium]
MYLKSLELHGFKSFPDKTVLKFDHGTTIIVGPNGSGKSNITDAMRWVLGELSSKTLRGSKMEDVIFSGADGVRPMGFAEVSITFDNSGEAKTIQSEYDEITVTRRYYRAGDSAYFINRKPCRLKDIYEIFMNTGVGKEGYSIIGQGRIAEIISKKSEDRRSIFEEAAGITKYRYRKNESQKKLAETEGNMARVGDIVSELEHRIGPLSRDADKARRYLELYDDKKRLDVSLWRYDMDRRREELEKLEAETKMSAHELEMIDDTIKQLSDQMERVYESSRVTKEKLSRVHDEINRVRAERAKIENDAKLLINNTEHAKRSLAEETRLRAEAEEALKANEQRLSELMAREAELTAAIAEAEAKCKSISDERSEKLALKASLDVEIERLFRERQKAESELGDLRVRLNVLKNSITEGAERRRGIDEEIAGYNAELEKLDKSYAAQAKVVDGYKSGAEAETARFTEADEALSEAVNEREAARAELSSVRAQIDSLSSRIAAMERMMEHFDGYNNSVKYVMSESAADRLRGIMGPLSHLIRVDSRYTVAMETSMGQALQNIVTADEASAKAAIASLKRSGAGRATFYPITTVKSQRRSAEMESAATCQGFIGFADELVECDEKYREIVRSVVGRICVFDNIDNASDMARARGWRVRAVTLDGQQINAGGSFTGGSAKRDSGMLTRGAQIDSMKAERDSKAETGTELSAKLSELESKIAALSRKRADADEKRRLMETLLSVETTTLNEIDAKRSMTNDLIARLEEDAGRSDKNSERAERDIETLETFIAESAKKVETLTEQRTAAAASRGEVDFEADELTNDLSDAQIFLAGLRKDMEMTLASRAEGEARGEALASEIERRLAEAGRLSAEIEGADEISRTLTISGAETDGEIEKLERERDALSEKADELDSELNAKRHRERELSSKKELLLVSHTKNENALERTGTEIDKMTSRLWDEYELTYSAAVELEGEDGYEPVTKENRARTFQM